MMHDSLYQQIIQSKKEKPVGIKGESENVRSLKEMPEAGPSSKDSSESIEREQDKVTTFWASTRSLQDLCRLQREDTDIGPIATAMESGKRPASQEMVTRSPACRHYWILLDSLI